MPTRKQELVAIARTDSAFSRHVDERGAWWRGKCLICNGHLDFSEDERVGDVGVTVDHILSRANGGEAHAPANLALVHARCNNEKGRRTDPRGPGDPKHDRVVGRLLELRRRRWRDPEAG